MSDVTPDAFAPVARQQRAECPETLLTRQIERDIEKETALTAQINRDGVPETVSPGLPYWLLTGLASRADLVRQDTSSPSPTPCRRPSASGLAARRSEAVEHRSPPRGHPSHCLPGALSGTLGI